MSEATGNTRKKIWYSVDSSRPCRVATFTSTSRATFKNWCWRSSPRVSRPADPASARKQGVKATKDTGSCKAIDGKVTVGILPRSQNYPPHTRVRACCSRSRCRTNEETSKQHDSTEVRIYVTYREQLTPAIFREKGGPRKTELSYPRPSL